MQISFIGIILIVEFVFILLLVTGFLLLRHRKMTALIAKLKERITERPKVSPKTDNAPPQQVQEAATVSYADHLDEQLTLTKQYHKHLSPDQDISLDLGLDNPLPRQVAALRHALLMNEKEAVVNHDSKETNWLTLQDKLSSIINF